MRKGINQQRSLIMNYLTSIIGILALIFGLVVIGCGDDDEDEWEIDGCIDDVAWKAGECNPSVPAEINFNSYAKLIRNSDTSKKLTECLCDLSELYCEQFYQNMHTCLCRFAPKTFGYHYDDYCD